MASEALVGAFTLGGVALGFLGALARDVRSEHRADKQARLATMSAARHVWYEVAEFKAATDAAAAVHRLQKNDLVLGPLTSPEQWSRHGDALASEETVDFGAVQEAYTAARFAADALLAGAPANEVRDQYRDQFEDATATLRPLAKLSDDSDKVTPEPIAANSAGRADG